MAATVATVWGGAIGTARGDAGGDFGLGLIVGDPTGVSGKYFLSDDYAIDGAVGLGLLGGEDIRLQAHVLWHLGIKSWPGTGDLDLYLGLGPRVGARKDDVLIGGRAPLGLALRFAEVPLDVFVEVALGLWIVEKLGIDLDLAAGGRFYF